MQSNKETNKVKTFSISILDSSNYAKDACTSAMQNIVPCLFMLHSISFCLYFPEEDVIRKLKALRTYYAREVAKEADPTRAGVSKDETYRPRWPFYDQLSFLREHITRRARPMPTEVNFILIRFGYEYSNPKCSRPMIYSAKFKFASF